MIEEECTYSNWGHSGICNRRQVGSWNNKSFLKIRLEQKLNRLQLFELMFMKDYVKDIISININKNIEGPRATYGEFLRWLGVWFLMSTVIGPLQDAFLHHHCTEFSEAPFCVVQYMTKQRFKSILRSIKYSKTKPRSYKDRFWEVRDLIEAWNGNMEVVFAPGWFNCLDESMSPWTNKYTCPGWICLPRKPWPLSRKESIGLSM